MTNVAAASLIAVSIAARSVASECWPLMRIDRFIGLVIGKTSPVSMDEYDCAILTELLLALVDFNVEAHRLAASAIARWVVRVRD